jgi:ATP-dependent protease ClpP protease subunit
MPKRRDRRPISASTHTPDFLQTARAIFIGGEINDEMVARLTIPIVTLTRLAEPITIFIDSDGGSVGAAQVLRGLLRTPSPSGDIARLTTVVTGRAHSAAADLLSSGDYVAAYSHASIHFHGERVVQRSVTAEEARYLQQDLLHDNKVASVTLARSMFPRMMWTYAALRDEVCSVRERRGDALRGFDPLIVADFVDLPAFAYALAGRVQDRYGTIVLQCLEVVRERNAVLERYRAARNSVRPLARKLRKAIAKGRDAENVARLTGQLTLLESLLLHRARTDPDWDIGAEGFGWIEEEFSRLSAVADEDWQDDILDQIKDASEAVISAEDRKFVAAHRESDLDDPGIAKRVEGIVNRAHARLEPLWSFTVAMCDELNRGENPMSPEDAWHLGLIDEVIGMPLTRRHLERRVKSRLLAQLPIAVSQQFY